LIVHELATNSLEYGGALSLESGTLDVSVISRVGTEDPALSHHRLGSEAR
jgi:two-component sensor histidine kinase